MVRGCNLKLKKPRELSLSCDDAEARIWGGGGGGRGSWKLSVSVVYVPGLGGTCLQSVSMSQLTAVLRGEHFPNWSPVSFQ